MKCMKKMERFRVAAFIAAMATVCIASDSLALNRQDVGLYVPFQKTLIP